MFTVKMRVELQKYVPDIDSSLKSERLRPWIVLWQSPTLT